MEGLERYALGMLSRDVAGLRTGRGWKDDARKVAKWGEEDLEIFKTFHIKPDGWRVVPVEEMLPLVRGGYTIPDDVEWVFEWYEVEDYSKVKMEKLKKLTDLFWLMDEGYVGFRVIVVSRYGSVVEDVRLWLADRYLGGVGR